jgi:ribosomal protein S18 acetylase RimI-like enzyme
MMIRRASSPDAGALAALHIACWQEAYAGIYPDAHLRSLSLEERTAGWCGVLADEQRVNFAGVEDGQLVGFASCGPSRDADAAPGTGELYGLYLRSGWWGTGRGWQLWCAARDELEARQLRPVTLWVLEMNARARRFYEGAGFWLEPGVARSSERGGVRLAEVRMKLA